MRDRDPKYIIQINEFIIKPENRVWEPLLMVQPWRWEAMLGSQETIVSLLNYWGCTFVRCWVFLNLFAGQHKCECISSEGSLVRHIWRSCHFWKWWIRDIESSSGEDQRSRPRWINYSDAAISRHHNHSVSASTSLLSWFSNPCISLDTVIWFMSSTLMSHEF